MKGFFKRESRLSIANCAIYASPNLAVAWLVAPVGIVQGVYAKYYGISLGTIAVVILMARLIDTISDPIVGICNDYYYHKKRTRKPFMVLGGFSTIVCGYFLYTPPIHVSTMYFTTWLILLYLSWTLFEVAHVTWASDLSVSSKDKNLIFGFRSCSNYVGQVLFYTIPLLPFFETTEITPDTLKISVIFASILMMLTLINGLRVVPNNLGKKPVSLIPKNSQISKKLRLTGIIKNRPFVLFVSAFLCKYIGVGLWFGLIFTYIDAYIGMGDQFSKMLLLAFLVGISFTPIWYFLSNIIGKKNVWLLSTLLLILSFVATGLLSPDNATKVSLISVKIIQTAGFSGMGLIIPAMLSEIIDYTALKEGQENSATMFAIYTFCMKISAATGSALGLGIAGFYGFDASAIQHSEESIMGIKLAISWLPILFSIIGILFIALIPIDSRRHKIIVRRLNLRAKRVVNL